MKIAFINNMNNNFFSIVRHLRDRGIDAHLFIFDEIFDGFFPEADTFDKPENLNYVHVISQIGFKDFFNPFSLKVKKAIKKLKQALVGFDLIFACGILAFFERAGMPPVDVFMPYGGDVYQLTDLFNYSRKKYFPYSMLMGYIMKYQIRAVQKARSIIFFASNDVQVRNAITRMGRKWIDWNMAMIYPLTKTPQDTRWKFLKEHDFVLFSQIRHTWKTGTDNNGNDRAIRGYAKFIKKYSKFKNPIFVLFEYGCDVAASKALIQELGIEQYVKWVPTMERKHIYAGLQNADMVTGIFNELVISHGGVTYEAFSCAKPVLGNARVSGNKVKHDLPLVHAFEVEEIAQALADFQENPAKYKQIGQQSKEWFERYVGRDLIDKYMVLIDLLSQHKNAKLESPELEHLAFQVESIH